MTGLSALFDLIGWSSVCLEHCDTECVFSRLTPLQNFITFPHSAEGLDRKKRRQKSASVQWKGIWVHVVIIQGCFSSENTQRRCHNRNVTSGCWSWLDDWLRKKFPFHPFISRFLINWICCTKRQSVLSLKYKKWGWAHISKNCLLSHELAWRIFKFLLAESSQALIFQAQLHDLKVLTDYAGEIAWRS